MELIIVIVGLVVLFLSLCVVWDYAELKGMSPWLWVVVSLVLSPIGSCVLIYISCVLIDIFSKNSNRVGE